jgi:twitching motility protein PilT
MDARQLLTDMIREVHERRASDLHVAPGSPAMLRVLGELEPSRRAEPLTPEETRDVAYMLMRDKTRHTFDEKMEVDFSFAVQGGGRYRVNVYTQRGMVNIALRVIPLEVPSVDGLGLPPALKTLAEERRGLILLAGTTGSGKSTTLAAIINHINETRKAHIMTIEDPIEFLHKNKRSVVNQRELGLDTMSYGDALRNVLRQDPNVILIGEMRDQETMAAAITSAQTGSLVLSTVHAKDTIQTINRIIDMVPAHQQNQIRLQLADTLRGVISQRLLPRADVAGRIPAIEILICNATVRKAIEDNNLSEVANQQRAGRYYGMQTFNQALVGLYNENKIRLEDAQAAATNPEELMLALRGIESQGAGTQSAFTGHFEQ